MEKITGRQLTTICRIFTQGSNTPSVEQAQALIDSGCLADLRDLRLDQMTADERFMLRNRIREVSGLSAIVPKKYVIDCETLPPPEQNWIVKSHIRQGLQKLISDGFNLLLNSKKITLFVAEKQRRGTVVGADLNNELLPHSTLNANVGRYLFEHPERIPHDWRDKTIYFWGTIFSDSAGKLSVMRLWWDGSTWRWDHRWLSDLWDSNHLAAILEK